MVLSVWVSHWQTTRWGGSHFGGGGAVFVVSENGDLAVYVDAAQAAADLEAIDVEDGEYPFAYRVDGAVLAILTEGELVVLDLTGEVDAAGLDAAIKAHLRQVTSTDPSAASPLDFAEVWLHREWVSRASSWPRWLSRRRARGTRPPTREQLAAPAGQPRPQLVHAGRLRELVGEVLAALPLGAVTVTESVVHGEASVHLAPRTEGAVDVLIRHTLMGVDVFVADSAPMEISAPNNVNYGPPERPWDDEVHDILRAVSQGLVLVGVDDAGQICKVQMPDDRLGVEGHPHSTLQTRRAPAWR